MSRIRSFMKSDEAIAVTEYGLLIALIALMLVGAVTLFGSRISSWFTARTNSITSV